MNNSLFVDDDHRIGDRIENRLEVSLSGQEIPCDSRRSLAYTPKPYSTVPPLTAKILLLAFANISAREMDIRAKFEAADLPKVDIQTLL